MISNSARNSDESITAKIVLEDETSLRAELVNFARGGAVLRLKSTRSFEWVCGARGRVFFLWEGKSIFQTALTIDQVLAESQMQTCSVRFPEHALRAAFSEASEHDLFDCRIPATISWMNTEGVASHPATVTRVGLGKLELCSDKPEQEVPFDVFECEMALNFPSPLGAVKTTARRLLTSEPGATVFATKSGATCLATQLISLWALRSASAMPELAVALV